MRLRPQKKMMPQDGAMLYLYGNSPRLEIHKRMVRILYKASERGLQHFIRCMLVNKVYAGETGLLKRARVNRRPLQPLLVVWRECWVENEHEQEGRT
jgi:hypothetical protein